MAARTDSFGGQDCSMITDPGGVTSGRLDGAFGQQFAMTIPVQNTVSSTTKTFRIFMGSHGGDSVPFVNFEGGIAQNSTPIPYYNYCDVLELSVPGNSTLSVSFSMVIPALASTVYVVGARLV